MKQFPNFRLVEIAEGVTAKVAPMRVNEPVCQRACVGIGEYMQGNIGAMVQRAGDIDGALSLSLAENHDKDEVAAIMARLRFSIAKGSAYLCCIMALMGLEPKDDVADGDDE